MITKINTLNDVIEFSKYLTFEENLSFHPDDDFGDYINFNTGQKLFSEEKAKTLNLLMNESFEICKKENIEIYEVVFPILQKQMIMANNL